jgi:hypothetical protein
MLNVSDDQHTDWLRSTNAERRVLYNVIHRLVLDGMTDWNTFLKAALGHANSVHYIENFRRGKNSRKDCLRLFKYLEVQFSNEAHRVLTTRPVVTKNHPWPMIERSTGEAQLWATNERLANKQLGRRLPRAHLSIGDRYWLELTAPYPGYAICFREMTGGWRMQRLSDDFIVPVIAGRQWLGQSSSNGLPAALETSKEERFDVSVIVGQHELLETITLKFGSFDPIPARSFNTLPAIFQKATGMWCTASASVSVMPRFKASLKGNH